MDIVSAKRIAITYDRFGKRFVNRILAAVEQQELSRYAEPQGFLARRFAAKEALAKALGTGVRAGIRMRDLVVERGLMGQPQVRFHSNAERFWQRLGSPRAWLSISDERDYVVALVVLEIINQ